ncbi:MAG: nitroreductase [Chthoniobacteraceae bacterium]
MELLEAIYKRRTIKDFKSGPVTPEILELALTAGIWAQNHRLTQPWRFIILGPETHNALAELFGDGRKKILSKPLIVAVTSQLNSDPQQQREDYAATCCAIQNIQLAAWGEGLGMQWSTSKVIRNSSVYELLKVNAAREEIVGLLFFGYPANIPTPAPRKPLTELTRHLP